MRATFAVGLAVVLCGSLSGCNNNQAKAEAVYQQVIDEMNKMSEAIEKGDKPARDAAVARMRSLAQNNKNLKITKDQEKAMEAKFKPQMDAAQEKMKAAMTSALAAGKLTPDDLKAFVDEMTAFAAEMKAMSK